VNEDAVHVYIIFGCLVVLVLIIVLRSLD